MQPLLFFLLLLSFSSLFLFSLSSFFSSRIFGLILPSAFGLFRSQKTAFSFGTFSNIQQDNALAFAVTFTLIFVNVSTSSNIQIFWSFLFSSKSELEKRGG